MNVQATMPSRLARAARVLLVFLLVFGISFQAESLAFAAMSTVDLKGHTDDQLTDLTVYQVVETTPENKTGLGKSMGAAGKNDDAANVTFGEPGKTTDLVAVPSWNGKKPSFNAETGDVEVAQFTKWSVADKSIATIELNDKTGVATLKAVKAGETTVTCELGDTGKIDISAFPKKGKATIKFKVVVNEPEPPIEASKSVTKVVIVNADGTEVSGKDVPLVLPKDQIGKAYAFDAKIAVTTLMSDNSSTVQEYANVADAKAAVEGLDVTWEASGSAAKIDSDGKLTFEEEGTAEVTATASIDGAKTSASVEVRIGSSGGDEPGGGDEPEPTPQPVDQGENNPQTTLTVVSNGRVSKASDASEDSSSTETPSSSSSSTENEGTNPTTEPGGSSSSTGSSESEPETIEKSYSVADLEKLGAGRATYTMYDGSEFVTVTGEGPYLIALLRDLGIEDTDQIESLTFENAKGDKTTITWSELSSANLYYPHAAEGNYEDATSTSEPMIAISSLVRGYGDGTDSSSDSGKPEGSSSAAGNDSKDDKSSSSSSQVNTTAKDDDPSINLKNYTQFRVLFGSTNPPRALANPDALRWVNKISVNMKPSGEEEDPGFDTDIDVSVEYIPVPLNAPAVFSALPNTAIKGALFDFQWQVSADDGKTWKDVENGDVQVLRVKTTKERLGYQYRVIMTTNASDKNGRENVEVTSKPVTMREGDGLAVVLEYDPPIAGQTAYFQTTMYGVKDGAKVKYTWQMSQDGGQNWKDIEGRTGSTLAVPTDPIDPNDTSESDTQITYIRAVAEETAKDGKTRTAFSEAVPLTVHTEGESKDPGDSGGTGKNDSNEKEDGSQNDDSKKKDDKKKSKDQDDDFTFDDDTEFDDGGDDDEGDDGKSTAQGVGPSLEPIDLSQMNINSDISDKVHKQEEAVQEYVESTVPGARWTKLSTSQASDEDVRNILADNPFAPFAIPIGLGFTVAGGLEKLLAFRRQR